MGAPTVILDDGNTILVLHVWKSVDFIDAIEISDHPGSAGEQTRELPTSLRLKLEAVGGASVPHDGPANAKYQDMPLVAQLDALRAMKGKQVRVTTRFTTFAATLKEVHIQDAGDDNVIPVDIEVRSVFKGADSNITFARELTNPEHDPVIVNFGFGAGSVSKKTQGLSTLPTLELLTGIVTQLSPKKCKNVSPIVLDPILSTFLGPNSLFGALTGDNAHKFLVSTGIIPNDQTRDKILMLANQTPPLAEPPKPKFGDDCNTTFTRG